MGIRLLFLSGIIYLIYMLPQNFFRLDYFNIDKVNITDNSKMLQNELTKLAEKLYNKSYIYYYSSHWSLTSFSLVITSTSDIVSKLTTGIIYPLFVSLEESSLRSLA